MTPESATYVNDLTSELVPHSVIFYAMGVAPTLSRIADQYTSQASLLNAAPMYTDKSRN